VGLYVIPQIERLATRMVSTTIGMMMRKKLSRRVEGTTRRVDFSETGRHGEFWFELGIVGASMSEELRVEDVWLLRRGAWPGVREWCRVGGCRVS
jgi:hypothetical protein